MRTVKRIIGVALALGMVVTATARAGEDGDKDENLLRNGSFEQVKKDWAVGWTRHCWPKGSGDITKFVNVTTEMAKDGKRSLKIEVTDPKANKGVLCFGQSLPGKLVATLKGKKVELEASIYVKPGAKPVTVNMRLRMFGKKPDGKPGFLGDVVGLRLLGKPGEWVTVEKAGVVNPKGEVLSMDLHCDMSTKAAATVQYIDEVELEIED